MIADRKSLRSGELARLVGVSPDTLRHYELKGLLSSPPRSTNGYRCYPADAVERVQLVRMALRLGFSIEELSGVFRLRKEGGVPCGHVRALAAAKLCELRQRQKEIEQLCELLETIVRRWDRRLRRTPPGKHAHLLDMLMTADSSLMARLAPPSSCVKGRKLKQGAT